VLLFNFYFSQVRAVRIHLSDSKLMKSGIPKKGSEATPEAGDNKNPVINSIKLPRLIRQ